jgi:hypothetical protein
MNNVAKYPPSPLPLEAPAHVDKLILVQKPRFVEIILREDRVGAGKSDALGARDQVL